MQQATPSISEEAREFLLRRPGQIIGAARIIFLVNILLVLLCLWFIKYPDLVRAPVIFTAGNEIRIYNIEPTQIKPGQKISISLNGHSSPLEGVIGYTPGIRQDDKSYLMKISLSNHDNTPLVQKGLSGQATITTGNRRLLERLLSSIKLPGRYSQ